LKSLDIRFVRRQIGEWACGVKCEIMWASSWTNRLERISKWPTNQNLSIVLILRPKSFGQPRLHIHTFRPTCVRGFKLTVLYSIDTGSGIQISWCNRSLLKIIVIGGYRD